MCFTEKHCCIIFILYLPKSTALSILHSWQFSIPPFVHLQLPSLSACARLQVSSRLQSGVLLTLSFSIVLSEIPEHSVRRPTCPPSLFIKVVIHPLTPAGFLHSKKRCSTVSRGAPQDIQPVLAQEILYFEIMRPVFKGPIATRHKKSLSIVVILLFYHFTISQSYPHPHHFTFFVIRDRRVLYDFEFYFFFVSN